MGAPSGEQYEIARGGQRACVVEVGAGLRTYRVDDLDVLDGYALDEPCTAARGQLLIPWPNRIRDGTYEHAGRTHRLQLTEPEAQNALHGLVHRLPWHVVAREADWIRLEHVLGPQPGYPFTLRLRVEYGLAGEGLSVTTTATNLGGEACPYGSGAHPYLSAGTATVDDAVLRVPARTRLVTDERGIPRGSEPVGGTPYDFRTPRPIGETVLDTTFTDLERDGDGLARIELADPNRRVSLTVWVDERHPYVLVFTGDSRPEVRRRSLAVEPMTCAPNAFRSGDGLAVLAPEESHTARWGIAVRR